MRQLRAPDIAGGVARTCPRCGGTAVVHGKVVRAIYDWSVTFVACERLRCCGRTFTATPTGLRPRLRYSERVIALARALAALGIPRRRSATLLTQAGVPVSPQAVAKWSRDVAPLAAAVARLAAAPAGDVCLYLRRELWLALDTESPRRTAAILRRELCGVRMARRVR